jgi:hypothetical protein
MLVLAGLVLAADWGQAIRLVLRIGGPVLLGSARWRYAVASSDDQPAGQSKHGTVQDDGFK